LPKHAGGCCALQYAQLCTSNSCCVVAKAMHCFSFLWDAQLSCTVLACLTTYQEAVVVLCSGCGQLYAHARAVSYYTVCSSKSS
jgi:hypothetical protein